MVAVQSNKVRKFATHAVCDQKPPSQTRFKRFAAKDGSEAGQEQAQSTIRYWQGLDPLF